MSDLNEYRQNRLQNRAARKAAKAAAAAEAATDGAEAVEAFYPAAADEAPDPDPADVEDGPPLELYAAEPDVGPPPARRPPPRPAPRAPTGPRMSKPMQEIKDAEETGLKEYLQSFVDSNNPIKVTVVRIHPKVYEGENVGGTITSYDYPIDEEELLQLHGGGRYMLKIQTKNDLGSWTFRKNRTVELVGPPLISKKPTESSGKADSKALDILQNELQATRRAAAVPQPGIDLAAIQSMISTAVSTATGPLQAMLAAQQGQIATKEQQLFELSNRPAPEVKDPLENPFLSRVLDFKGQEAHALRAAHDAELRMLKQSHVDDLKREQDKADRAAETANRAHDREMANMRSAHEATVKSMEAQAALATKLLEGQIRSLERDLAEARVDIKELRSKKEMTIGEKIKEMKELKDMVGGDEEEKSTIGQIIDGVMSSKPAEILAGRLAGIGQPAAVPAAPPAHQVQLGAPPQQQPAVGQPFYGPDGGTYMLYPDGIVRPVQVTPDGTVVAVNSAPPPQRRPGRQAPQPPAQNEFAVDPEQARSALQFLENAYNNGTDPKVLASSMRPMVPDAVLGAIRDVGVDAFLEKVARLEAGSPLAQQKGRLYARQVAKHLLGGE